MRKFVQPLGAIVPVMALCLSIPATSEARDEIDDPAKLPAGLYPALVGAIQAGAPAEYDVAPGTDSPTAAPYRAHNAAQEFEIRFGAAAPVVGDAEGRRVRLEITGYGYAGDLGPVPPARLVAAGNRLEYRRGGPADGSAPLLTEWYVNGPLGLEQGFTLAAPPPGKATGQLVVALAVTGDLKPALAENGRDLTFLDAKGTPTLRYHGLYAHDATGRQLPAKLALDGKTFAIEVAAAGAAYPLTIDPFITGPTDLPQPDGVADDRFGWSVAISGNTAVVGAGYHDEPGIPNAGAAYVFVREGNATTGTTEWTLKQKLTAVAPEDCRTIWSGFGFSVAIDGDTLVVGAPYEDDILALVDAGAVYIFERDAAGNWVWETRLTAPGGITEDMHLLGYSVAIDGDVVVAGAPHYNVDGTLVDAGRAFVFERVGGIWGSGTPLAAPLNLGAGDWFGFSVAISGDTAVVGAPLNDDAGPDSGAAYVFTDPDWTVDVVRLDPEAGVLAAGDQFGHSVSISGDYLAVGAPLDDDKDPQAGKVYLFERSGADWLLQDPVYADDLVAQDKFARSVALSGKTLVVGTSDKNGGDGAVYVFTRGGTTPAWVQRNKLEPAAPGEGGNFGRAVAVHGEGIVVGAPLDDTAAGANAGSAVVYDLPPTPKDFDGDGISDILLRGNPLTDGMLDTVIWQMNGFTIDEIKNIERVPTAWEIIGTGDFNADSQDDILWHHVDGRIVIWQMSGLTIEAGQVIEDPDAPGTPMIFPPHQLGENQNNYVAASVADFDGDGRSDVLWTRPYVDSTGTVRQHVEITLMDGFTIKDHGDINNDCNIVDTSCPQIAWRVMGADDFNHDGKADILWHSTQQNGNPDNRGKVVIWPLDGLSRGIGVTVGTVNADIWVVKGIGDFDLDEPFGHPDILWRNLVTGNAVVWRMDDLAKVDGLSIGAPSLDWRIEDVADYSGDGHADILWRRYKQDGVGLVQRPLLIWQMNGFTKEATASLGPVHQNWVVQ